MTDPLKNYAQFLRDKKDTFADSNVALSSAQWLKKAVTAMEKSDAGWRSISTFWPPRCVEAFSEHNATVFFGAGLSLSAGFPSWRELLVDYFQMDQSLVDDDDLKSDPLTLAELAAQAIGNERLQQQLREVFGTPTATTTSHRLLAKLNAKVYVTTNYDNLFELAWEAERLADRNNKNKLLIATNDTHVDEAEEVVSGKDVRTVLFKIHGCVKRESEHLILTRRDYRQHYRANTKFFNLIIGQLRKRHTLFVGFSHRDPEVSRLVDDAIHQFEARPDKTNNDWPQLYSLQFDMRSHTPEVFAARGIVALTPPAVLTDPKVTDPDSDSLRELLTKDSKAIRSHALAAGLCDLIIAERLKLHTEDPLQPGARLDKQLGSVVSQLIEPLDRAIQAMLERTGDAIELVEGRGNSDWLAPLRDELGDLASQGLFVANFEGKVKHGALPKGLAKARLDMIIKKGVSKRSYFQIAMSYRTAFISDLDESFYNKNGTFFLCQPLLIDDPDSPNGVRRFAGLIFSASQVGQWKLPIQLAEQTWKLGRGFVLTDSNGVCLLPAFGEFQPEPARWQDAESYEVGASNADLPEANVGYAYKRLLGLSRRDQLVRHIAKSVVPVQQDDDVLQLAKDSKYYTVVSEIKSTRWKLALSMPMEK